MTTILLQGSEMVHQSTIDSLKDFVRIVFSTRTSGIASSEAGNRTTDLIAKFRTITTLIHTIDPTFLSDPKVGGTKPSRTSYSPEELRALRVLTALAIAISREGDVSAVITSDHRSLENGHFRVIASHHPQSTSHHQFFALRNPQRAHPKLRGDTSGNTVGVSSSIYEVLSPKIDPTKLEGNFLDNRNRYAFEDHVAILTFLLNEYLQAAHRLAPLDAAEKRLTDYVVIQSAPRMCDRMDSKASKDLLEALVMIDQDQRQTAAYPIAVQLTPSQISRDIAFLKLLTTSTMRWYLGRIKIPTRILSSVSSQIHDRQLTFYNDDTSSEIHTLLVAALQDICESVKNIKELAAETNLRPLVIRASTCANLLRFFVHSSAAPAHFTRLNVLLTNQMGIIQQRREKQRLEKQRLERQRKASKARKDSAKAPMVKQSSMPSSMLSAIPPSMPPDENAVMVDDIDEELEEGLNDDEHQEENTAAVFPDDANQEQAWLPIVRQYMHWLRRQVSHVESVRTLCRMARRWATLPTPPTIAVNVLAIDHQGTYMTPWQDVIKEVWAELEGQSWTVQDVVEQLITNGVFTATNTEPKFYGTLHCEACLMTLLHTGALQDKIKEAINDKMIGVSKRCCPVCTKLLELLYPNLHIAGSHFTIYACTLPTWLPEDVLSHMVDHFQGILRDVLLNVMQNSQSLRRQSGDSVGLPTNSSSEDVSDGNTDLYHSEIEAMSLSVSTFDGSESGSGSSRFDTGG